MTRGKCLLVPLLCVAAYALSGCGGGGSSSQVSLLTVLQDLDLEPNGTLTVLTFSASAPDLAPGALESSGGQTALSTAAVGPELRVTWDAPVAPGHSIRFTQGAELSDFVSVATSNPNPPTYQVSSATQVAGLGGDQIEVQFAGPFVTPSQVVDPTRWSVQVNGVWIPLDQADFAFDEDQQTLSITTDESANLHAAFALRVQGLTSVANAAVSSASVPGVAAGDSQAPTLLAAVQRLEHDPFGRVVEFQFDEAMSPLFATSLANYSPGFPTFAQSVVQVQPELLRVTFTQPVVPGLHNVLLLNVLDAHGNAYAGPSAAISAGSTVANAYAVDPLLETQSGAQNDRLVVVTQQALAPETALDFQNWSLSVGGAPVDLSAASFQYNLLTRTLTVGLGSDFTNGGAFELTPAGVLDVDGQAFAVPFTGQVAGDQVAPAVLAAQQNRQVDPTGRTFDVRFTEAVDPISAEDPANYVPSGTQAVTSVTLLQDGASVRLELDAVAVPGLHQFAISQVTDLAGNAMAALPSQGLTSTDTLPPTIVAASLRGFSGPDNDTVEVTFSDSMVADDVLDHSNWVLESPVGVALDMTLGTITYDELTSTARFTLDGGNGVSFAYGADFALSLGGMRDIGGNANLGTPFLGSAEVEAVRPVVESVWVRPAPDHNQVWVRFDEAVGTFSDSLAVYQLRDQNGFLLGEPVSTPVLSADGRGVRLTFGLVVGATNRLDVLGVTDLAGNTMFPELGRAIEAEDPMELAVDLGSSGVLTVAGEANDLLTVVLDRVPSRLGLLDSANYSLSSGGQPVSLVGAEFHYDGDRTVEVHLGPNVALSTGAVYELTVDGLVTAQGVPLGAPLVENLVAGGDSIAPVLPNGSVRLDATNPATGLLVDFDEAVDGILSADVMRYSIGALAPISAQVVGPRTVRVDFGFAVFAGDTLDADVTDLAGNTAVVSRLVTAADTAGPLVTGVDGLIQPGFGGDRVRVRFHKPVDPTLATQSSAYGVTSGGVALDLSTASLRYSSVDNEVTLFLAPGQELRAGAPIQVTVSGVQDHAGFAISPAGNAFGTVSGDALAPSFAAAFANRRESATGLVVDVRFSEDVDPVDAQDPAHWSISSGQGVVSATALSGDVVRLVLATPLNPGDQVLLLPIADAAGNLSAPLSVEPVL